VPDHDWLPYQYVLDPVTADGMAMRLITVRCLGCNNIEHINSTNIKGTQCPE
jgi:hypothetical protein